MTSSKPRCHVITQTKKVSSAQGLILSSAEALSSGEALSSAEALSSGAVLEACDLSVCWNKDQLILRDLSLSLEQGELSCMLGPSGCGKTTLLHTLAGLLKPCHGQVYLEGKEITGVAGAVSYMLQKDLLFPHFRVLDNVALPLVVAGKSRTEARSKARAYFERFGLAGYEEAWPHELSGGMRQRAAFLRTYLSGNKVMLLDEPFSALDAITRRSIRSWFYDMAHELGLSVLLITHDIDEAVLLGDRVFVLKKSSTYEPSYCAGVIDLRPARKEQKNLERFELTRAFLDAKSQVYELFESV